MWDSFWGVPQQNPNDYAWIPTPGNQMQITLRKRLEKSSPTYMMWKKSVRIDWWSRNQHSGSGTLRKSSVKSRELGMWIRNASPDFIGKTMVSEEDHVGARILQATIKLFYGAQTISPAYILEENILRIDSCSRNQDSGSGTSPKSGLNTGGGSENSP